MNKLLLYSLFLFFSAQATELPKKEGFLVAQKLDSDKLSRTKGFDTLKDNEYFKMYDYDVNHVLHILNHDNTPKNVEACGHMRVPQSSNNEHISNLKGSTIRGADIGFWLSKLAVHAVAQIAYALIAGATSLVYPPAAPVVYCSLQFTFAALVEIASNIVAMALGATTLA